MIVVDSSIWADHIHHPVAGLSELLGQQRVAMHRFVIGEIMLGNLASRASTSWALRQLDPAPGADDAEVLGLIESARLFGTGIGYVDAHLLASTLLIPGGLLWTRDKRLLAAAGRLGIAYPAA
jgi:predicted nucleic acid-binding protein